MRVQVFTSYLLTGLHDHSRTGDQVSGLLADLGRLVVQTPQHRTADLWKVGLHPLPEGVHNGAEAVQHHRVLLETENRINNRKDPVKIKVLSWELLTLLTSVVCSWKAYRMPSISCSSSLWSMSAAPRLPMIFSMVSITIFLYCSASSFRSSTMREMISAAPTLLANSTVVSTNCWKRKTVWKL